MKKRGRWTCSVHEDPQEISGIGSCLYERRIHTSDRDGKTCSGAMAQLGNVWGNNEGKKGIPSSSFLSRRSFHFLSSRPFARSFSIAHGWLVSLLHGRMATENTRRRGHRAQTERISPLVRDLRGIFLSVGSELVAGFASRQNRSAMKTRTICEYQLYIYIYVCTITRFSRLSFDSTRYARAFLFSHKIRDTREAYLFYIIKPK